MKLTKNNTYENELRSDMVLSIAIILVLAIALVPLFIASADEPTVEQVVYDEIYGPPFSGLVLEPASNIRKEKTSFVSWYSQNNLRSDLKLLAGNNYGVASAYVEHGTRYLIRLVNSPDLIVVTVNDYCAGCLTDFDQVRRFDLSREAFEALDTLSTGVIEIEYMELKGEGLSYE